MTSVDTPLIKRSVASRAKYSIRGGATEKYSPSHVVLHPKNSEGDPVDPVRCRNLSGSIARDGYDRIGANTDGCCMQQKSVFEGGSGREFQDAFSRSVAADGEIAEFGTAGIIAIVGSLSHGHLNCVSRNIAAGLRGCECLGLTVVGKVSHMKCTCKARRILDVDATTALRVVLSCMSEDDYLYDRRTVATVCGRSQEYYALQSVVLERVWPIQNHSTGGGGSSSRDQQVNATRGGGEWSSSAWSCNYTSQAGKPNTTRRASSTSSSN